MRLKASKQRKKRLSKSKPMISTSFGVRSKTREEGRSNRTPPSFKSIREPMMVSISFSTSMSSRCKARWRMMQLREKIGLRKLRFTLSCLLMAKL